MDWVNAIWQKVNKPLYYLFVGTALLAFAPPAQRWTGFIFVAFGAAGAVEWLWKHGVQLAAAISARHAMRKTLGYLNADERGVLLPLVAAKAQSFYLDWHQYHGLNALDQERDEYQRLAGIYGGLAMKGVIAVRTEDTMANFQFLQPAWGILLNDRRRHGFSQILGETLALP